MTTEARLSVVVPIHEDTPDAFEEISLRQCLKAFADRPITFVHRRGMNLSRYQSAVAEAPGSGYERRFLPFPETDFASRYAYNDLMLSPRFYRAFLQYEYILLYQLDAYAFSDRLDEFLDMRLDYLGAPCFEGRTHATDIRFTGHENGGLSLRRTAGLMAVCRKARSLAGVGSLMAKGYMGKKDALCLAASRLGLSIGGRRPYRWEDMFFSFGAPLLDPSFRVGSFEQSSAFAFDFLPEKMYEETGRALPFGCHGFYKNGHWDFWKAHIAADSTI